MKKEKPQREKQNIFMRLLALGVTAALIFGGLFLVLNWDRYNLDAVKRRLALRSIRTGISGEAEPFTHGGGGSIDVAYLSDGLVMTSTAGVHYYTFAGEQYLEQVTPLEHPVLAEAGSYAVAYDAGGKSLWMYCSGQEVFHLTLEGDGDLLAVRPNESGWLAVTAQESGYKGVVTVYNGEHERVFRLNRSSTFVVDAAVSPDCKRVAVVTVGQQEGRFESKLLIYRLDREEPEQEILLGSGAPLDLEYESGQIWVLGENMLTSVDTRSWESYTYSFGRSYLKGCALGGDNFALVLLGRYRAGSAEQAIVLNPEGEEKAGMDLHGQLLSFDAAGKYLCLLGGGEMNIYTSDFELYRSLTETQGARYTALAKNGSALMANRQQAWMYIPD
jgi:hypothetical protein